MSKISDLVSFALVDKTNTDKAIKFGSIPNFQAQEINQKTKIDIKGGEKVLTARGIRHAFKGHGDKMLELERGQIAITKTDFEFLPVILNNPDFYSLANNSRNGKRESLVFIKIFNEKAYNVIMSKERGDLVFATMFIKKNKADVRYTPA